MYAPVGHEMHWTVPAAGAIVPAAQRLQCNPLSDADPLGQGVQEVALAGETFPSGQGLHSAEALALAKVPAAHGAHVVDVLASSVGDAVPGGHSSQTALPASEYVPVPQVLHVEAKAAPTAAEARPAGHSEQLGLPLFGA